MLNLLDISPGIYYLSGKSMWFAKTNEKYRISFIHMSSEGQSNGKTMEKGMVKIKAEQLASGEFVI